MRKIVWLMILVLLPWLVSCSTIETNNNQPMQPFTEVCIEHNPAVSMKEFHNYLVKSFQTHGISAKVEFDTAAKDSACSSVISYEAARTITIAPHLSHAKLVLWQNGEMIKEVEFNLPGGGINQAKFSSLQRRADQMVQRLLEQ